MLSESVLDRMHQIDHFLCCRKMSRSKKKFSAVGVRRPTDGKTGLLNLNLLGGARHPAVVQPHQLAHTPDHSRHHTYAPL